MGATRSAISMGSARCVALAGEAVCWATFVAAAGASAEPVSPTEGTLIYLLFLNLIRVQVLCLHHGCAFVTHTLANSWLLGDTKLVLEDGKTIRNRRSCTTPILALGRPYFPPTTLAASLSIMRPKLSTPRAASSWSSSTKDAFSGRAYGGIGARAPRR